MTGDVGRARREVGDVEGGRRGSRPQPVEVGDRPAERQEDPVDATGRSSVRARADEVQARPRTSRVAVTGRSGRSSPRTVVDVDGRRRRRAGPDGVGLERLVGRQPVDRAPARCRCWSARLELVGVALDGDDLRLDGRRARSRSRAPASPVTSGLTGRVRDCAVREHRDRHVGRRRVDVRPARRLAEASTGTSATSWSTSIPDGLDEHVGAGRDDACRPRTRARRRSTCVGSTTVVAESRGRPGWRPARRDRDLRLGERVEVDGHPVGLVAEDRGSRCRSSRPGRARSAGRSPAATSAEVDPRLEGRGDRADARTARSSGPS